MGGYYQKVHVVTCVDCGVQRETTSPTFETMKRCKLCQYEHKRRHNTKYVKRQRKKQKK